MEVVCSGSVCIGVGFFGLFFGVFSFLLFFVVFLEEHKLGRGVITSHVVNFSCETSEMFICGIIGGSISLRFYISILQVFLICKCTHLIFGDCVSTDDFSGTHSRWVG